MLRQHVKTIFIVVLVIVTNGCASTRISKEQIKTIDSVTLAPHVQAPANVDFVNTGLAELLAPVGGLIGGLAEGVAVSDDEAFTAFLTGAGIDIGKISRAQLESKLKNHKFWGTRLQR